MTDSSIRATVDRFIQLASPQSMDALIREVRSGAVTDADISYLAASCASSWEPISARLEGAADVASTGGPTSLSTLLCPLFLRCFGHDVPKLGVPGRPAGGIDVLAQIPGFRFRLSTNEAAEVLKATGYVHFLADEAIGNRDAVLFAYRKRVNAVNLTPLVIASLLSKKLAVGVHRVGLDVRVAPFGNFGTTWDEARSNAARFCRVASTLGISSVCFLTDGSIPYQPYVGRAESLVALADVLSSRCCPHLRTHVDLCYAMARSVSGSDLGRPNAEQLKYHFEQNVIRQGGDVRGFWDKARSIRSAHRLTVTAETDGFLALDIAALRSTLVASQDLEISQDVPFPDPLGVILKSYPGEYVRKGDVVATVRADNDIWHSMKDRLTSAFFVTRGPARIGLFEEVNDA